MSHRKADIEALISRSRLDLVTIEERYQSSLAA